ncbi:hypothetical protein [Bacteroides sp. 519]|uniref:hypothetical protein n=1 Tax=Bacteroides sp. 519 TaxID=2302937 RepID=UPI0013D64842|nr:hypothetical protein [Bacteroides sp. 519]NDV59707.1 hypothetical protein [Bacteroides sp. 519]
MTAVNEYCLKITNLENSTSYTIEKGKFYACFTDILDLGRIANNNFSDTIEVNTGLFKEFFTLFKRIRVRKLLKKYGFTDDEISSLFEEFNLEKNIRADELCHILIKASLYIDILFKQNDLILFNTIGLSYQTISKIYHRIYQRMQLYPNKTAVVFENIVFYDKTEFEIVSKENINNYLEWRESHEVQSLYHVKFRNVEDIASFDIEKGAFYSCHTSIPDLAKKLFRANYPNSVNKGGIVYENKKIFKYTTVERFFKKHIWNKDTRIALYNEFGFKPNKLVNRLEPYIKASILIDLLFFSKYFNEVIFFEMKDWPSDIYPQIINRINKNQQEFPEKTVVVFVENRLYGKTFFELVNKQTK